MSFSHIRFTLLLALVSLVAPSHTFAAEKRIVIGYVARDLNNFPVLLTEAKGFFRDAGITAELVQVRSTVALPGILGGAIDYTTAFGTSIGRAMQGAPLRGVLAMVAKPSFYLVARPEIRAVTELKGKIIAVGSLGTVNHLVTQKVLANFGIGPEDATIMAIGDTPVRMAAVKSGTVQATMAAPPAPIQAKEWGFNVLAYAGDYVDLPLAGLATTRSKIKDSRGEVVSVVKAILRALVFMRTSRAETIALIQKLLKMERSVAEATYDLSLPSFSKDGSASNKGIQSIIEMSSGQAAGRQATPADVVDFGPLRDAQAALGIR
ncbi:MAG TPA: ABC transporter substrate-binding protein [Methylomirabilota bacterium]|nr:ABC transporter substrate-binding protein [Methylomirabilota bacterium]